MSEGPVAVLVVGLAGSGKSTLMNQINAHTYENSINSYFVNMDPATSDINFSANIDIRDTVDYNGVMDTFNLGPNGAILTSLNLFSTKIHEVISLIGDNSDLKFAFFDTPGQIEAFAWSASGGLITQALSSTFKTVVLFVVDVPRCSKTPTFVSTMLYACSVLYRSSVPMVMAFTKTDVQDADQIVNWMKDVDSFEEAVDKEGDDTYFSDFTRNCGSILSELYDVIPFVRVSGKDGRGVGELIETLSRAAVQNTNK